MSSQAEPAPPPAATGAAASRQRVAAMRQEFEERKRKAEAEGGHLLEDLGELGRSMDHDRWRKRVGVSPATRVFVCNSVYPDFKRALIERGWKQNPDAESPHWDLHFALRPSEFGSVSSLRPGQMVNHFAKASAICTKAGLLSLLRNVHAYTPADHHAFYPRAYDLSNAEDYMRFVDDYRAVEAEVVLRRVVTAVVKAALGIGKLTAAELAGGTAPSTGAGLSEAHLQRVLSERGPRFAGLATHPGVLTALRGLTFNRGVVEAAVRVTLARCSDWSDIDEDDAALGEEAGLSSKSGAANGGIKATEPTAVASSYVSASDWQILRYCDVEKGGGPKEQGPAKLAAEAAHEAAEAEANAARERMIKQLKKATANADAVSRALESTTLEAAGKDEGDEDEEDDDDDDDDEDDVGWAKAVVKAKKGKGGASSSSSSGKGKGVTPAPPTASAAERSAVAAHQMKVWRERLAKESGGAVPDALNDDIGRPEPTLSSATAPELAAVVALSPELWARVVEALRRVNASDACQASLGASPPRNIWIVKPAGKSRGRGIECQRSLSRILHMRGGAEHKESAWVIQKYIERPLLIHKLKWDIRQWVLVSSWAPLTVWVYDECYLRFCCYPFELGNLSNKYIHLSNNSIQKHSEVFDATAIEGNMWPQAQFAAWLQEQAAAGAWDGLTYDAQELAAAEAMGGSAGARRGLRSRGGKRSRSASAASSSRPPSAASTRSAGEPAAEDDAAAARLAENLEDATSEVQVRIKQTPSGGSGVAAVRAGGAISAAAAATFVPAMVPLVDGPAFALGPAKDDAEAAAEARRLPVSSCPDIWNRVLRPQLLNIIRWSLQAAQETVEGRPGSFEVYGYDFMIDADLHPWLIEINSSPDFSYSTHITERLVKAASEDVAKVVVDYGDWESSQAAAGAGGRGRAASGKPPKAPGAGAVPPRPATSDGAASAGAPPPDTGGWSCIYKSAVAPSRTLLTCVAHDLVCVGKGMGGSSGSGGGSSSARERETRPGLSRSLSQPALGHTSSAGAPARSAGPPRAAPAAFASTRLQQPPRTAPASPSKAPRPSASVPPTPSGKPPLFAPRAAAAGSGIPLPGAGSRSGGRAAVRLGAVQFGLPDFSDETGVLASSIPRSRSVPALSRTASSGSGGVAAGSAVAAARTARRAL